MYKPFRGAAKTNNHLNVVRHNTKQNLPSLMTSYASRNSKLKRYSSATRTHYRTNTAATGPGAGLSHTCGATSQGALRV